MVAPIPNVYHFVFGLRPQDEPFHLAYYLALESCRRVNRPERIWLYYHHEPWGPWWDRIKPFLTLEKVDLVDAVSAQSYDDGLVAKYNYAHHADFIRVEKLIERGGVYADMDSIFVNPLPPELFEHDYVLGQEAPVFDSEAGAERPSLCNAVIMSRPGAEFGRRWLEEMPRALDGRWSTHSCFLAQEIADRHPALVHVEPSRSFYRHMWTREGLHDLFVGPPDRDLTGVYSLHLWNHLWWDRDRTDFTRFHADMIDERVIRAVDTTYNLIARPFLPPGRPLGLAEKIRLRARHAAFRARVELEEIARKARQKIPG